MKKRNPIEKLAFVSCEFSGPGKKSKQKASSFLQNMQRLFELGDRDKETETQRVERQRVEGEV